MGRTFSDLTAGAVVCLGAIQDGTERCANTNPAPDVALAVTKEDAAVDITPHAATFVPPSSQSHSHLPIDMGVR